MNLELLVWLVWSLAGLGGWYIYVNSHTEFLFWVELCMVVLCGPIVWLCFLVLFIRQRFSKLP